MDNMEFECSLRELIMKSKEFEELNPNLELDLTYSKEETETLDHFKRQYEELYNRIKVELEVDFALISLERRCSIEMYRRLKLSFAKDYWENEDVITVCSDGDLITLINIIKRIRMKEKK